MADREFFSPEIDEYFIKWVTVPTRLETHQSDRNRFYMFLAALVKHSDELPTRTRFADTVISADRHFYPKDNETFREQRINKLADEVDVAFSFAKALRALKVF